MSAHVLFESPGIKISLPGDNHGFVTTPIVSKAILDIRKTLEFFRIGFDKKTGQLKELPPSTYPDDLTVETLGLKPLTVPELEAFSWANVGKAPNGYLLEMFKYANKQMAHFSITKATPDFRDIMDGTKLGMNLLWVFVYDATNTPRPKVLPVKDEN